MWYYEVRNLIFTTGANTTEADCLFVTGMCVYILPNVPIKVQSFFIYNSMIIFGA